MGWILKVLYPYLKKKKKKERILPPKKKEIEVFMYKTKYHDQITCFVIVMILTII